MRRYPFELTRVLNGSTFLGWIDLGFDMRVQKKVRLVNVKCHEPTTEPGAESKRFVEDLLTGKVLEIEVFEDKFHKWSTVLVVMWVLSGERSINLNDLLVEQEPAFAYKGEAHVA